MKTLMIWPNADAGSDEISKAIRVFREQNNPDWLHLFVNLPINIYIQLMHHCACMLGNSSSAIREGEVIRRRRVCVDCHHRFTTYEEVVRAGLKVVKRNGELQDFNRNKILAGIKKSCEKRPVSEEQIDELVDRIVKELEAEYEKELPGTAVGQKIMDHLERLDEIAYVRFASVYRRYRDVNQFLSEVESLIGRE